MKKFVLFFLVLALAAPSAFAASNKKSSSWWPSSAAPASNDNHVNNATVYHHPSANVEHALSGTVIRPLVGFNFMSPKAVNSDLQKTFNNNTGIKIGSAMNFGLATDFPVWEDALYLGFRFEYLTASSGAITIGGGDPGTAQASISAMPLMFTTTYAIPLASRLRIGSTLGLGLALGYKSSLEFNGSNNAGLPDGSQTYGATPFAGLGQVWLGFDITRHVGLRLETGFRLLSSSQMTATDTYAQRVKEGELYRDDQNKNISVDANAFQTGLSMAITL